MQSQNELLEQIIANRWRIVRCLGQGNMSYVYEAQNTQTGKVIILKLIKSNVLAQISDLENFTSQIKQFIALNHENVSSYYDVLVSDGHLFLVCDYLQGESLAAMLAKTGRLPLEKCVILLQKICAGLEYAHQQKVLHGDIRPSNIFIVNDQFNLDEPKIVDFGFMHLIDHLGQQKKLRTTSTHPILGNATYLSPEQRIDQHLTERSDLYSFGCLMYEMSCGKSPFTGKSAMETTYRQKIQSPTELSQLLPSDPLLDRYQQVVSKLLQLDPKKRYQTASLLLQDLSLINTAKDIDWQKKANVLKESKYSIFLKHKKQILSGALLVICLIVFSCYVYSTLSPFYSAWKGTPINTDRLWLVQDKYNEGIPTRLLLQKDFQSVKVAEVEKKEGKSSTAYLQNVYDLVQCLLACRQWREAQTKLVELQSLNSSHNLDASELLASLSFCQLMLDDTSGAEQCANQILNMPSQYESNDKHINCKIAALKILGDVYNQRNDIQRCREIYTELYTIVKAHRLSYPAEYAYAAAMLADTMYKAKRFNQAEEMYKEAIDWGGNYIGYKQVFMAKALYGIALAEYQQGKSKLANMHSQQALQIAAARRGPQSDLALTIDGFSNYVLFHQDLLSWLRNRLSIANLHPR